MILLRKAIGGATLAVGPATLTETSAATGIAFMNMQFATATTPIGLIISHGSHSHKSINRLHFKGNRKCKIS